MNKYLTRSSVIIVTALFLMSVAFNSVAAVPAKVQKRSDILLGLSTPNISMGFWVSMYYGVKAEAAKEGVKFISLDAGGYNHIGKQTNQIRNLMERKVSVLMVGATNAQGVAPVVRFALNRGFPVVGMSSLPAVNGMQITVGADHFQMGVLQATAMAKKLGGKGEVGMMNGPAGASWAVERRKGFLSYMEKQPNIKIIVNQWTDCNKVQGVNLMQDWLTRYPKLSGVYTACNDLAMGAADVVKGVGRTGQIVITTSNLSPVGESYIEDGEIYANASQQIVLQGRLAVVNAVKMLLGQPYKKHIVTAPILVTQENIKTLDLSQVSAPSGFNPGG